MYRLASEAVALLKQKGENIFNAPLELIASDVLDHYRTYSLLEKVLHTPPKLSENSNFQLEPQSRALLIEKYYSLDDSVSRELLGKKLSSKHRKDLDEVSERTGVRLKSCRRQFDNFKRIYKAVEEQPGNMVTNIRHQFLLSEEVARKYSAVVFIACLRFETTKRKLQYLSFTDFFESAQALMNFWTYSYAHAAHPDYYDTEMDKEFLLDLRELKCLLDKEKEIKHFVLFRLKPTVLERAYQEIDQNFRNYFRGIIAIASTVHRQRDLKNLFVDFTEKLIEPWKQNNWSIEQVKAFLPALTQSVLDLEVPRDHQDIRFLWDRYMQVTTVCLIQMYH